MSLPKLIFFLVLLILVSTGYFIWSRTTGNSLLKTNSTAGSCKILEEKFCFQGELIDFKTPNGREIKYIAFDLPAGTQIISSIDGQANKADITQPSPFVGKYISIANPNDPNRTGYNFTGNIVLSDPNIVNMQNGKVFGTIGNSGEKMFGKYNFVFNITDIDPATRQGVLAEDKMKKLFPNKL